MAKLGSARSAVDESFSGGSVNLENNWRRKEFVFPDVVAWQGEDGHAMARRPGSPKYTARGAEEVRWVRPFARLLEHPPESKGAQLATG